VATLIFYAIVALAVGGTIFAFQHNAELKGQQTGVAKQFAADKPLLDYCAAAGVPAQTGGLFSDPASFAKNCIAVLARQSAQSKQYADDLDACTTASQERDAEVVKVKQRTDAAIASSKAVIQQQAATQADFDRRRAELNTLAQTATSDKLTCEARLATIDVIVTDALRRLREQPGAPTGQ
jgi:hypothetical protein